MCASALDNVSMTPYTCKDNQEIEVLFVIMDHAG